MKRLIKLGHCPEHPSKKLNQKGQCDLCLTQHKTARVGRSRMKLGERPLPHDYDAGYTLTTRPDGTFTKEAALAYIDSLLRDPVKMAMALAAIRRPKGVAKERFGTAIRAAVREPMLNADPAATKKGLEYNQPGKSDAAVGPLHSRIAVKAASGTASRYGGRAGFWGERLWSIHPLKYGHGFVARTDIGDTSSPFNSVGQLRKAIKASGWSITRTVA